MEFIYRRICGAVNSYDNRYYADVMAFSVHESLTVYDSAYARLITEWTSEIFMYAGANIYIIWLI